MGMNTNKRIYLVRVILVALAVAPVFWLKQFYEHFVVYLTGTVLSVVVKEQWHLVLFFILLFSAFAVPLSYRKRAKWVDYSLIGAFFVSLFIEMYGIPLTILFASKYLFTAEANLPDNVINLDFFGVGLGLDHAMAYGSVLMVLGMALIILGWWSLYRQAKKGSFARTGLYALSRNPQYLGFIFLILGWFFGWPTILTLVFSPLLIYKYYRAARSEEKDMLKQYGNAYKKYMAETPFLA